VKLYASENRYVALQFHTWHRPRIWEVLVPFDWLETMFCLGFFTLHWERRVKT
jgi:hypothetical protein